MIHEITVCNWRWTDILTGSQASHGRWGQTAATSTNTTRRDPCCASTGGDTRWVRAARAFLSSTCHPNTCWQDGASRCRLMCWWVCCVSLVLLSLSLSLFLSLYRRSSGQCTAQLQVLPPDLSAPDAVRTVPAGGQSLFPSHGGDAGQIRAQLFSLCSC